MNANCVSANEDEYRAGNEVVAKTTKLVVLSGCSGGGKSTLLAEMARRGHTVFPEPGRQVVKEQVFIGGDALPWDVPEKFIDQCVSRAAFFFNSAQQSTQPVWFDRSIVDAISAYGSLAGELPSHYKNALANYRYYSKVFLVPPWQDLFAEDAERQNSFENAVVEFDRLVADYPKYGYQVVQIPKRPVVERADFLEQAVNP